MSYEITTAPMTLADLESALSANEIILSAESQEKINAARDYLDSKLEDSDTPIYGINTGFGALYNVKIEGDDLSTLQKNLVLSHACGTGDEVPPHIVKLMLFLKIRSLAFGHSGVHLDTAQRLVDMYNNNVLPVVYQLGSLGASGDLAPLAHLSLALLGEGDVDYNGKRTSASEALSKLGWAPLELRSKEGLALLNGTQFMSAYGLWCLMQAGQLTSMANKIAALSLDAFNCSADPFSSLIHNIRPHSGQLEVAEDISNLREGSEILASEKEHVQDPYSFRCIPQVHGASLDALRHIKHVFETELNSVSDNPNIFPEQDAILSGGNFHGQPLAINLDYLCIALAEIGSISERRTYQLINGKRDLPPFLVKEPGLNSGLMIPQYTAASVVSQNKQLCTPSSVDSIDSSAGQEDHVSMGANAATKTYRVVKNLERILAIELLTASQALEFRRPAKSSATLEEMMASYRQDVPFIDTDRKLHDDIEMSIRFLHK